MRLRVRLSGIAMIGWAVVVVPSSVHADDIRWIGWSKNEDRHAYFLREPRGETGITSSTLIVRESSNSRLAYRKVVRDAAALLREGAPLEESDHTLTAAEQPWIDDLIRKGYRKGHALRFDIRPRYMRMPDETLPGRPAVAIVHDSRRSVRITPTTSANWAILQVSGPGWRRPVEADRAPIVSLPFMTGTPEARMIRVSPNYPIAFHGSPGGRWIAAIWQGRAILPDGFSWPAYSFVFPRSRIKPSRAASN